MKPYFFILALFTSCFSSKPVSQGHHYQLYLTNDLGINVCLLAYENYLNQLLILGLKGELTGQLPTNQKVTQQAVKSAFHFQVNEANSQSQSSVPVDHLLLKYQNQTLFLFTFNPFSQDTTLLISFSENQNRSNSTEEILVFSILKGIPNQATEIITPAQWYRFSQQKLEDLQKSIAQKALNQYIQAFDAEGKSFNLPDLIKAKQETTTIQDDVGNYQTIWQDIPEQDLWKGFILRGHLQQKQLSTDTLGLLYHPRSKFGGYNPGNIPWFIFSLHDGGLSQNELNTLHALVYFAQLYSLDPEQYTSAYFKYIKLYIRNMRYP